MDFTPHTPADVERLLATLGLSAVADLFAHLPAAVRPARALGLPGPLAEAEVMQHLADLAKRNASGLVCFAGGGIYDHFLPPVVRALTLRPEFVTSYTPYQSEVSQGVLQALYEYQSMVAAVTGLPVANASLYDGATAALEAVNLAVGATGRRAVWLSRGLSPGPAKSWPPSPGPGNSRWSSTPWPTGGPPGSRTRVANRRWCSSPSRTTWE